MLILSALISMASPYRLIEMAPDDTADLFTRADHSTVVEFDDKPLTVILGNPQAYSVEYVRNAITIKPSGVPTSTNLIVFLPHQRFSFVLHVDSIKHDSLVTVKAKVPLFMRIVPKLIQNTVTGKGGALTIHSYFVTPSRTSVGFTFIIDCKIQDASCGSIKFLANSVPIYPVSVDVIALGKAVGRSIRINAVFRLNDLQDKTVTAVTPFFEIPIPPIPGVTHEYKP